MCYIILVSPVRLITHQQSTYCFCFTNEETNWKRLGNLPTVTQLVRGRQTKFELKSDLIPELFWTPRNWFHSMCYMRGTRRQKEFQPRRVGTQAEVFLGHQGFLRKSKLVWFCMPLAKLQCRVSEQCPGSWTGAF